MEDFDVGGRLPKRVGDLISGETFHARVEEIRSETRVVTSRAFLLAVALRSLKHFPETDIELIGSFGLEVLGTYIALVLNWVKIWSQPFNTGKAATLQ